MDIADIEIGNRQWKIVCFFIGAIGHTYVRMQKRILNHRCRKNPQGKNEKNLKNKNLLLYRYRTVLVPYRIKKT